MTLDYEISNRFDARLNLSKSPYLTVYVIGDSFTVGENINIYWSGSYYNKKLFQLVDIELWKNDEFVETIETRYVDSGSYVWEIDIGGNCSIKVKLSDYSEVYGFSNVFVVGYTNEGWILTNYKYDTNTFEGLDEGWVLALEYYDTDFEGLEDSLVITNESIENDFEGLEDSLVITNESIENDFEGLPDGDNVGVFTDGSS